VDPFAQLKQQFVSSFAEKADALQLALEQTNVQALTVKLHQLAGSSGSYGFDELAEICAGLESMTQNTTELNSQIKAQTVQLIQLLRQHSESD